MDMAMKKQKEAVFEDRRKDEVEAEMEECSFKPETNSHKYSSHVSDALSVEQRTNLWEKQR